MIIIILLSGCSHSSYQRLCVKDGVLVNEEDQNVQLKGMSSHGIQWFPEFIEPEMIASLKEQGAQVFRIAIYPDGQKGYVQNRDELYPLIQQAVHACIDQQMYCILDWHVLEEETPIVYQKEALEFFANITADFPDHKGILYEICNEPNGDTDYDQIRYYADSVIPVIRRNSPNAVILVGGPSFASQIDGFLDDPLPYNNLLFTLHYYPGLTDEEWMKRQIRKGQANGQGVFISEWGFTVKAEDESFQVQKKKMQEMMDWLTEHQISWTNWSFTDKDESYSFFKHDRRITDDWEMEDVSQSGRFVLEQFRR